MTTRRTARASGFDLHLFHLGNVSRHRAQMRRPSIGPERGFPVSLGRSPPSLEFASEREANVPNWMMRWVRGSVATKWSGHASHASCRAGQADAVRGSEDDRVDAAYADAVRIYVDLSCVQQRTAGHDAESTRLDGWVAHPSERDSRSPPTPAGWRIRVRGDDALGSRKRGHEMVCDMPVMQQGRQMQLAEVHVGCNS